VTRGSSGKDRKKKGRESEALRPNLDVHLESSELILKKLVRKL
jgi:hypothetical protein